VKALVGLAGAAILAGAACAAPSAERPQGERVYRQNCYACHAIEPDGSTPAGPTLHAIVGRPIAADRDFAYSQALRRLSAQHGRWTPELLDRFLADPEAVAPGTQMGMIGIDDAAARGALIDWLGAERAPR
jgi:cytochrome c